MGGVTKAIKKVFKPVDQIAKNVFKIANPVSAILENNVSKSNALRQIVDPTGIARQNYKESGNLTVKNATDPGSVFTKSDAQLKAADDKYNAAVAQASAPTIDSAASAAQQATDRLRRRRGVLANIFGGSKTGTLG